MSTPIAPSARALPNAPSLEYERKEAKAFLKQVHAGDPEAVRRVHAVLANRSPNGVKLADVQHVIAREYGFTSWPRLVEYFDVMERHRKSPRFNSSEVSVHQSEGTARRIIQLHQQGNELMARELGRFVPRFFGRSVADILATPIAEDEARLIVARQQRRVSWDELMERSRASEKKRKELEWEDATLPSSRAWEAIRSHDVAALAAVLDDHPDLLSATLTDREWRNTLGGMALSVERSAETPDARRVTDLLASRGVDIQRELDERLLGWPHDGALIRDGISPEVVRWYLARGANPEWMPPNGITVLEHAIIRYMNGASVDLIASRVTPRRALWIAAGLGDVAGVRRFIAGKEKLTPEGRLNRPDHLALGSRSGGMVSHPDADDLEIMYEAFKIAGWNQRWAAMDALLEAGLPVDYSPLRPPMIYDAVCMMLVPLTEYLVSRGADLDREYPGGSPRSWARSFITYEHAPLYQEALKLLAICKAGTAEEILAELDASRQSPPPPDERTARAMQLAADDAGRQGQSLVTTENMLIGILRLDNGIFVSYFRRTGMDMIKLRERLGARLLPDADPLIGQELPGDVEAQKALQVASGEADARRRQFIQVVNLIYGVLSQEGGAGVALLQEMGARVEELRERMKGSL